MHPYTDGELDTLRLLQPLRQVSQGREDTQTSTYRSSCVIFMGMGIAKIDEKSIPKELSNVPVKTLDDFRTSRLIGTYDFPVLFGVELR